MIPDRQNESEMEETPKHYVLEVQDLTVSTAIPNGNDKKAPESIP